MIIETPRLLIRPLRAEDAEEIQAAKEKAWPALQMWMNWAHDNMKSRAALDQYIAGLSADNPWDAAAAFSRDDGRFAALGGLHGGDPHIYSTGYWCAPDQQGKGYATEMTNALMQYAFGDLGATDIRISYYEGNTASRRVIDKLGFVYSHTVKAGHNRCSDGTPLDVHHFSLRDPAALPPLAWQVVDGK